MTDLGCNNQQLNLELTNDSQDKHRVVYQKKLGPRPVYHNSQADIPRTDLDVQWQLGQTQGGVLEKLGPTQACVTQTGLGLTDSK